MMGGSGCIRADRTVVAKSPRQARRRRVLRSFPRPSSWSPSTPSISTTSAIRHCNGRRGKIIAPRSGNSPDVRFGDRRRAAGRGVDGWRNGVGPPPGACTAAAAVDRTTPAPGLPPLAPRRSSPRVPAIPLLQLARANNVSLIVLGAPWPKQKKLAWLRSVASNVTANAHCSVHVVRVPGRKHEARREAGRGITMASRSILTRFADAKRCKSRV